MFRYLSLLKHVVYEWLQLFVVYFVVVLHDDQLSEIFLDFRLNNQEIMWIIFNNNHCLYQQLNCLIINGRYLKITKTNKSYNLPDDELERWDRDFFAVGCSSLLPTFFCSLSLFLLFLGFSFSESLALLSFSQKIHQLINCNECRTINFILKAKNHHSFNTYKLYNFIPVFYLFIGEKQKQFFFTFCFLTCNEKKLQFLPKLIHFHYFLMTKFQTVLKR